MYIFTTAWPDRRDKCFKHRLAAAANNPKLSLCSRGQEVPRHMTVRRRWLRRRFIFMPQKGERQQTQEHNIKHTNIFVPPNLLGGSSLLTVSSPPALSAPGQRKFCVLPVEVPPLFTYLHVLI